MTGKKRLRLIIIFCAAAVLFFVASMVIKTDAEKTFSIELDGVSYKSEYGLGYSFTFEPSLLNMITF